MNQAQTIALYQPMLHAIAMNLLRCKSDAEDIVQDTFLKWLSVEQEKIKNTKAYLIKAVTNNCLNHLTTLRKKKEEYLETLNLPDFILKIKESDLAHMDIEAELSKALSIIHQKLEPLERAVYLLKEVFDFDYEALQSVLNKKQDHCRQLLCRAKKKLSEEASKINWEVPTTTQLMESFRKASIFGNPTDLVSELRKDISPNSPKKP
jgi:RNA polymerase sigma factor (sigma-70 family)